MRAGPTQCDRTVLLIRKYISHKTGQKWKRQIINEHFMSSVWKCSSYAFNSTQLIGDSNGMEWNERSIFWDRLWISHGCVHFVRSHCILHTAKMGKNYASKRELNARGGARGGGVWSVGKNGIEQDKWFEMRGEKKKLDTPSFECICSILSCRRH